jgi:hypothetical protein
LTIPTATSAPRWRVNERRQGPHVIGQLLTGIPQRQNLSLGGRIGDREAADLAIDVAEGDPRLVGPGRLDDRGGGCSLVCSLVHRD